MSRTRYTQMRLEVWLDRVVAQRARCAYWNVNYFGVIRAIAMARAVVGHRERGCIIYL